MLSSLACSPAPKMATSRRESQEKASDDTAHQLMDVDPAVLQVSRPNAECSVLRHPYRTEFRTVLCFTDRNRERRGVRCARIPLGTITERGTARLEN